jgi:hypothetical protein
MDKYKWQAVYSDGETLSQYNDKGLEENSSEKIDRDKIVNFLLFDNSNTLIFVLHLDTPKKRFIYRRRYSMNVGSESPHLVVHLVGWQMTISGKNIQSITYIVEPEDFGGVPQIHATGRFDENHPIFYSPQFLDCEKEAM